MLWEAQNVATGRHDDKKAGAGIYPRKTRQALRSSIDRFDWIKKPMAGSSNHWFN